MITVSEANDIITRETGRLGSELVELGSAVGRVLTAEIVADSDLPPFNRSQMDGFAVQADDTRTAPVRLDIVGESAAGNGWNHALKSGEAVRIMTGAPVPAGADAVQKVELTAETESVVEILEPIQLGKNIVTRGSETRRGDTVILSGEVITESMIAVLAAFGCSSVNVAKRPRLAILSTGSEIVDVDQTPDEYQIRNSNSPMLAAFAERCGCDTTTLPRVVDDLETLKSSILAAANDADILIITGGVSVGKYDLTKPALRELGGEIFFERVSLKPGKPTVFAKLGNTVVFGLPGNPVSAAVTFHLFVRLAALQMQSAADVHLRNGFAVLATNTKAARERDTYLPAKLDTDREGRLIATPTRWQGSSDFIGFARAEALIFMPKGESRLAGDVARIEFL